jgi:hypothetical protein
MYIVSIYTITLLQYLYNNIIPWDRGTRGLLYIVTLGSHHVKLTSILCELGFDSSL